MPGSTPSGSRAGAQCGLAAMRRNGSDLAGLASSKTLPPLNATSSTAQPSCGAADAVQPAVGARAVAAGVEFGEAAFFMQQVQGTLVVTGVDDGAGRGVIWKGVGRDEVAAVDLERIEFQLDRDALHQPLQCDV